MSETSFEIFWSRIKQTTEISSQTELARVLGVNRSAVTQAKQRNIVPQNWIFRLARRHGLSIDWLERGQGNPREQRGFQGEFHQVPKVKARLCAGGGSFESESEVAGYYAFRWDWLRLKGNPNSMVLMDIVGDSMEPLIQEGDTVLIDQSQQDLFAGRIYAVGIDDTVMVKRVEKHPGKLVLISANSNYYPIFLQGDELETVRIIGLLVWSCRELS